ncbi:MAG: HD domain-containing protein [Firmicutes bacterium]|nr:HD domain-containing protein [Bacillota bacterium]
MEYVLSVLNEVNKSDDISIYVVGQYIIDRLLGISSNEIEIVIENGFIDAIDRVFQRLDFDNYTKEVRKEVVFLRNKEKNIEIRLIDLKNHVLRDHLQNRVITIDSMALPINLYNEVQHENIIDPYGGLKDLQGKKVRNNLEREDALEISNILKAVRLMSQYNFDMDGKFKDFIVENHGKIETSYSKNITDELFKILKMEKTYYYFKFLDQNLNIFQKIFPEISPMKEVGECKYHVVDVFKHSLYTMEILELIIYSDSYFEEHIRKVYKEHSKEEIALGHSRLEFIKLGAFFHDVGKPSAMKIDETGRTRFRGHEITGAEIIKDMAENLGLSIKERDLLYRLVAKHMIPLVLYKKNDVSGKTLYKMFKELGDDTLDVLLIALADIIATRKLLEPTEEMGKFKIHVEYIANNYLTRFKEVEDISHIITGKNVIKNFDLGEDVLINELIEEVRKAIYNGKIGTSKEAALKFIEGVL